MMKKLFAVLLASVMVLSLVACGGGSSSSSSSSAPASSQTPASSEASDSGIKTVEPGKLIVGTSADFAPYEFHMLKDGKDIITGFDMDLAQAIADDLGLELVIKDMNFDSILIELNSGTIDLAIAGLSPDPERAKAVDFSDAYYTGTQCVMVRKADADKYKDTAALKGLPVGAQTGSIQEGLCKELAPDASLVSLTTIPNIIMELKSSKIEAAFMETAVADGYVAAHDDLMIAFEVPYEAEGSCAAVKKGNTALLDAVNATIKKVVENGDMIKFVQVANELAVDAIS